MAGFSKQSGSGYTGSGAAGIAAAHRAAQKSRQETVASLSKGAGMLGGALGGALTGAKGNMDSAFGGKNNMFKGALEGAGAAVNPQFKADAGESKALGKLLEKYGKEMGIEDIGDRVATMGLHEKRALMEGYALQNTMKKMKMAEAQQENAIKMQERELEIRERELEITEKKADWKPEPITFKDGTKVVTTSPSSVQVIDDGSTHPKGTTIERDDDLGGWVYKNPDGTFRDFEPFKPESPLAAIMKDRNNKDPKPEDTTTATPDKPAGQEGDALSAEIDQFRALGQ